MHKIIVTDLDNTLLNSRKEVTPYSAQILRKCQEKGILTAFATARPERATAGFRTLFQPDYIISDNGATISCNGKIIFYNPIAPDITNTLLTALSSMKNVLCITAEAGDCLYINQKDKFIDPENWNLVYHDFTCKLDAEVCKFSIQYTNIDEIHQLISRYPGLHLYTNSNEDWCQVMEQKSTKFNAIQYIAAKSNISIEDVLAFGDDYNDVEMLSKCGTGVAVANANEEARKQADFICESNDNDGAARYIEQHYL